ncbi:MAG: NAD(P)H-dependent oxidoreductase subunit E [Planctomycetaceae bacterium]|jgi:NADH-quinone oxidoreductase subunit E|nr:NAD(P)H-dependent oxidoreductase subunit E [Planctomycetaceae bacterium]
MAETTSRKFTRVMGILEENNHDPARLIPILQQVQEDYRYLPEDVMTFIATSLDLPPSHVFGVATFYAHFTLIPKGKHIIRLCDGTACHVRGSEHILNALHQKLKLSSAKHTTDDMLFTVECVSCLGACGLAPVMVLDEKVHSKMTPENAINLIDKILEVESGGVTSAENEKKEEAVA